MFKINISGLNDAKKFIAYFETNILGKTMQGIHESADMLIQRIKQRDPALGNRLFSYRERNKVWIYPEISPELWELYLREKTPEERQRAEYIEGRCPVFKYREPIIRKGVIEEYPEIEVTFSGIAQEAIADQSIKNIIVQNIKGLL